MEPIIVTQTFDSTPDKVWGALSIPKQPRTAPVKALGNKKVFER